MSFGWSASDIATLVELAAKTINNSRKASGEYDELTREVTALHVALRRLQKEADGRDSMLGRSEDELAPIANGCRRILDDLDNILVKYNGLSQKERTVSKLWLKVKFGNGRIVEVADLRAKITYYTSALGLYVNMVTMGSVGRVEKQMDEAGGDLKEIKVSLNSITAHLMSAPVREGSVLTAYAEDDRAVWKEFRRELVKDGYSSRLISKYKDTIKAYIKELGSRGLLDDPALDAGNTDNSSAEDDASSDGLETESASEDLPSTAPAHKRAFAKADDSPGYMDDFTGIRVLPDLTNDHEALNESLSDAEGILQGSDVKSLSDRRHEWDLRASRLQNHSRVKSCISPTPSGFCLVNKLGCRETRSSQFISALNYRLHLLPEYVVPLQEGGTSKLTYRFQSRYFVLRLTFATVRDLIHLAKSFGLYIDGEHHFAVGNYTNSSESSKGDLQAGESLVDNCTELVNLLWNEDLLLHRKWPQLCNSQSLEARVWTFRCLFHCLVIALDSHHYVDYDPEWSVSYRKPQGRSGLCAREIIISRTIRQWTHLYRVRQMIYEKLDLAGDPVRKKMVKQPYTGPQGEGIEYQSCRTPDNTWHHHYDRNSMSRSPWAFDRHWITNHVILALDALPIFISDDMIATIFRDEMIRDAQKTLEHLEKGKRKASPN